MLHSIAHSYVVMLEVRSQCLSCSERFVEKGQSLDMSFSGSEPASTSTFSRPESVDALRDRLSAESLSKQLQSIEAIAQSGDDGLQLLMDYLLAQQANQALAPSIPHGKIYQALYSAQTPATQAFLSTHFPTGILSLQSQQGVDYAPLQTLLAQQDFEEADRVTIQKLCELAGDAAIRRKWLYFTEVQSIPTAELRLIDTLWLLHSDGKFGYSVQRELWLGVNKDWDRLWPKIGWRSEAAWTRYPQEFIWNLSAPRGHLPLSNQLRGVRVMQMLMTHPVWTESERNGASTVNR